jgi:hypothetical protein
VSTPADAITEVLAAHELRWTRPYEADCSCGRWHSTVDPKAAHQTHVASFLVDLLEWGP